MHIIRRAFTDCKKERNKTYFSETSDANALVDVITFAFYGRFERGYQAASV